MLHSAKINPDATPTTLATTMSTILQRRRRVLRAVDVDADVDTCTDLSLPAPA